MRVGRAPPAIGHAGIRRAEAHLRKLALKQPQGLSDHGRTRDRHVLQLDLSIVRVDLLAEAPDLVGQGALDPRRQCARAEGDEIGETAGFRLLDVAERLFLAMARRSQCEADGDQAFIDGEFVLEERDLQILGSQMAAKLLETTARFFKRRIRRLLLALGFSDQPKDEIGLVAENRGLNAFGLLQRGGARALGGSRIAGVELESRKEQLTHGGFTWRRPLGEEFERAQTEALSLEIPSIA